MVQIFSACLKFHELIKTNLTFQTLTGPLELIGRRLLPVELLALWLADDRVCWLLPPSAVSPQKATGVCVCVCVWTRLELKAIRGEAVPVWTRQAGQNRVGPHRSSEPRQRSWTVNVYLFHAEWSWQNSGPDQAELQQHKVPTRFCCTVSLRSGSLNPFECTETGSDPCSPTTHWLTSAGATGSDWTGLGREVAPLRCFRPSSGKTKRIRVFCFWVWLRSGQFVVTSDRFTVSMGTTWSAECVSMRVY